MEPPPANSISDRVMFLATSFAVLLPLSLSFWIISLLGSAESAELPSPFRWLLSISLPFFLATWGYRKGSLDLSGAICGFLVGFVITLSNYCFMVSLITFFVTSSKATKFGGKIKKKIESDYKEAGRRNWVQVISNGGIAAELSLMYLIEKGISGEIPINYVQDFNASWFAVGVLASISCANGDTWASELSPVLTNADPRLITDMRIVRKGTNGGVTITGLVVSALGGLVVGLFYYLTLLLCASRHLRMSSPAQWPLILIAMFAGLLGSLIDSLLGATLQYSGFNYKTGKVVEEPGTDVEHISGLNLLDNHSVNLVSNLITALLVPQMVILLYT